jgi:hypothetical protein
MRWLTSYAVTRMRNQRAQCSPGKLRGYAVTHPSKHVRACVREVVNFQKLYRRHA